MKVKPRKQVPKFSLFMSKSKVLSILDKITQSGYEAYIVGGAVRDMLRGYEPQDYDITTNAKPEVIKFLFPNHISIGEAFGTITVLLDDNKFEVTTFRAKEVYSNFRSPDQLSFSDSLEEDSKRRDFTINALYCDTKGDIFDPQGGLKDLKLKIIKSIGNAKERFSEDALRVLRTYRFASQLGFKIEARTNSAAIQSWSHLNHVSSERIYIELKKMLEGEFFEEIIPIFLRYKLFDLFSKSNNELQKYEIEIKNKVKSFKKSDLRFILFIISLIFLQKNKEPDTYSNYYEAWSKKVAFRKSEQKIIKSFLLWQRTIKFESATEVIIKALNFLTLNQLKLFLTHDVLVHLEINEFVILQMNEIFNQNKNEPNLLITTEDLVNLGVKLGPEIGKYKFKALELQLLNPKWNKKEVLKSLI